MDVDDHDDRDERVMMMMMMMMIIMREMMMMMMMMMISLKLEFNILFVISAVLLDTIQDFTTTSHFIKYSCMLYLHSLFSLLKIMVLQG